MAELTVQEFLRVQAIKDRFVDQYRELLNHKAYVGVLRDDNEVAQICVLTKMPELLAQLPCQFEGVQVVGRDLTGHKLL